MIHAYELNGHHIVLDVGSGSVHVVDEPTRALIEMYSDHSGEQLVDRMLAQFSDVTREDVLSAIKDIEQLRRAGKLFTPDMDGERASGIQKRTDVIKALCLHVAHTCNLNCEYCFASQGKYHGERALMSFEVGKQALDFLMDHSGSRKNLEVDFFGGEPLMNWDVVKQLVMYAREVEASRGKHFRFTLTTNGVLLDDEVAEFCNREMHNVVLSLDGRKDVHDRLRKTVNGQGSYDLIVPKFQRFVEQRGGRGYYMRGTFTHENTDFLQDILHMADLGFDQLSMEPMVGSPDDPCALTEDDLPALFAQYEQLALEMLRREKQGKPFTFYHYMLDLKAGPCLSKRVTGCGSGTEYMAVTPWGDLYPCHQFVGDEGYLMGDVWRGVTNTALRDEFAAVNVFSHEECRNCWAQMYCSGGCAANAYHATGSITGVYEYGCALFKKRIECAIMMQVEQQMAQ